MPMLFKSCGMVSIQFFLGRLGFSLCRLYRSVHIMVQNHPDLQRYKYIVTFHCSYYRMFQKNSSLPPKTFWNILTSVKSFRVKLCRFVGSSYSHTSTNFCRYILKFHQMALIFQRVPIIFTLSSFEYAYSPRKWKCSFLEMTSFFVIACLSVR